MAERLRINSLVFRLRADYSWVWRNGETMIGIKWSWFANGVTRPAQPHEDCGPSPKPLLRSILSRSYSLRVHLLAFGIATFLPAALFATLLLVHVTRVERQEVETWLKRVADNIATEVDRELDRRLTVLNTLTTSPALRTGDLAAFHAQAKAALEGTGAGAFLIDPASQQQLANTYVPFGTMLPTYGSPQTAARVIDTGQPQVSGHFIGRVSRKPAYDIAVPVLVDGTLKYVLALGLLPHHLVPILQAGLPDPNWVSSVVDQNDVVLARSRDHDKIAGTALPEKLRHEMAGFRGLVFRSTSLDGYPAWRAITDSRLSGWHISVSVPLAVARAPLTRSLWLWGVLAALSLVLTLILAAVFARLMERPMRGAAAAAQALGRGETIEVENSRLDEAQTIVSAIREASLELKRKTDQQSLLLRELSHRVKNILAVIQSVVTRTLAGTRPMPEARKVLVDRILALARAHDLLVRTEWKGAPLKDIIAAELTPFAGRFHIEGPDLILDGSAVQTFVLLLHELATNAAKHGSLSNETGSVAITWEVQRRDGSQHFFFRWQERGGPPVQPPSDQGFGSALLRMAVPGGQESQPRLSFDRSGFLYEFECPLAAIVQG